MSTPPAPPSTSLRTRIIQLEFLTLAVVATLFLAKWQWDSWQHGGTAQNLGYALQWPAFGLCFIYGYRRFIRLEELRQAEEYFDELIAHFGNEEQATTYLRDEVPALYALLHTSSKEKSGRLAEQPMTEIPADFLPKRAATATDVTPVAGSAQAEYNEYLRQLNEADTPHPIAQREQ